MTWKAMTPNNNNNRIIYLHSKNESGLKNIKYRSLFVEKNYYVKNTSGCSFALFPAISHRFLYTVPIIDKTRNSQILCVPRILPF